VLGLRCNLTRVSNYVVIYVVIVNDVCDIRGSLLNISLSILLFLLALFFFYVCNRLFFYIVRRLFGRNFLLIYGRTFSSLWKKSFNIFSL